MSETYKDEKEGQRAFYEVFLPRINPALSIDDVVGDNNDGVINGNLIEFKIHVKDLNVVLFQCIKYLSALRVKGKPVPANIVIVDVNAAMVWLYRSEPYLQHIEKLYTGGASKDNGGFIGGNAEIILHYDKPLDAERLISILKEYKFTKIHIDENCVVGWATAYYKAKPTARKEDFIGDQSGKHKTIGEIRNPTIFADYIYPYEGETNAQFKYLMDRLNDSLMKKNTGAFYTHPLYAQKSLELVRKAIARVPEGNDYIILDRCAGTGNLESYLTDEELSHCVVSTIEYYEYKVLLELLGSKVRHIIPPIETADTFNAGLVTGADALSKEYIENPIIQQYLNNPNCTIILFENPPYAETTSIEWHKKGESKKSTAWKQTFVVANMKKEIKGAASNELGNAFIWSGFKYYLRHPADSYIVYSPVKYWKVQQLVEKKFLMGFAFNRRHFHTNIDACIMCALWANIPDVATETLELQAFDVKDETLKSLPYMLPVKKVHTFFSKLYYDSTARATDTVDGILTGLDGLEAPAGVKRRIAPKYGEDILGYMVADSSGFDNPDTHSSLLVAGRYNGNGFYVRKNNYLEKLPMFCASRYIKYNHEWTERSRVMKSADASERFAKDIANGKLSQYLLKCLLFTCLEMQNHMRTFTGSDGRFYRNELCLDGTNGETIALRDIKALIQSDKEKGLLRQWETVLRFAKACEGYDPKLTYGVYQIYAELDTSHKDDTTGETIWDNIELHSALQGLKQLVKDYYNAEIVPVLFEYEFLK